MAGFPPQKERRDNWDNDSDEGALVPPVQALCNLASRFATLSAVDGRGDLALRIG
jgi:hypothetical protein